MSRIATDSQSRRRNRDKALRARPRSALDSLGADSASLEPPELPAPGSLEELNAKGYRWLRFPAALEAEFQADVAQSRRLFLLCCMAVGVAGFWAGSANDPELAPDLTAMFAVTRPGVLGLMFLIVAILVFLPERWKRNWQYEALTSLGTLAINAVIILIGMHSQATTAFAHTTVLLQLVMYASIAARQRFRWVLGTSVISVGAYVALVHGHTLEQQLIVNSTIKLFLLALVFTLIANYAFEYRERQAWVLRKLDVRRRAALEAKRESLRELSMRDALTGLYNRRQFDAELAGAWQRAVTPDSASPLPVCLLLLDIDFFKLYNDNHGHPAGDACLHRVAQVLARVAAEEGGVAARVGGEEFGFLLPQRSLADASEIGQRLCHAVCEAAIEHRASSVMPQVTVSVGVAAAWPSQGDTAQALLDRADHALYRAKREGRNRACAHPVGREAGEDGQVPRSAFQSEPVLATREASSSAGAPPSQDTLQNKLQDTLQDAPQAGHAELSTQQLSSTLAGKFRWLRFPKGVEAAFQRHHEHARMNHLLILTFLGLALFNVYVASSRAMFPDIADRVLTIQFWITAPVLVCMGLAHACKVRPWVREALYALAIVCAAVVSAWILSQSRELTVLSFAGSFLLVPLFACVAARQPFWIACGTSLVTLASMAFFSARTPEQALVLRDSIFNVCNGTLYSLIAGYTLERGLRKEWLLSELGRRQTEAVTHATERLRALSTIDPLTGISNRRQFESDLSRLWGDALRGHGTLALVVLDVDFFKAYNDTCGHPAGDRCLRQVADAVAQVAEVEQVYAARMGGEEFGLLLPGRSLPEASAVAMDICKAIERLQIEHRASKVARHVTVSLGVASIEVQDQVASRSLIATADDALYRAKAGGRNQVAVATAPIPADAAKAIG
ncbi:MAG: GGDEF domain-containing protein [Burkholderiales bacterium]|nr:GGDEF domain-containing protein [Burkholderiales bacterium]